MQNDGKTNSRINLQFDIYNLHFTMARSAVRGVRVPARTRETGGEGCGAWERRSVRGRGLYSERKRADAPASELARPSSAAIPFFAMFLDRALLTFAFLAVFQV